MGTVLSQCLAGLGVMVAFVFVVMPLFVVGLVKWLDFWADGWDRWRAAARERKRARGARERS